MARQLTLIADLRDILGAPEGGIPAYSVRPARSEDEEALARLYLAVYPKEIVRDLAEVRQDLRMTFEGEYGPLDLAASPLAFDRKKLVAGVLTVTRAPWPDTPDGPFIIDVMVLPDHRRRGLAAYLMREAARRLASVGKRTVALRVMSDNTGALGLYRRLGFRRWTGSP